MLRDVAVCLLTACDLGDGIAARIQADKFAILYPATLLDSDRLKELQKKVTKFDYLDSPLTVRVGRYVVIDKSLSLSAMFDRATIAERSIQGRYDLITATYDESMRQHLIYEQKITTNMARALETGEFQPWFQPQFNHATGELIGAEALVRWCNPKDGIIIPTFEYIQVFERNGFIYELDKYVWEEVCKIMRRWLDEGRQVLPTSVNISRMDLFHNDFFAFITDLPKKYNLPLELLRLEVTESAFTQSENDVFKTVNQLIDYGFTVEIDDFGSGYSSLNTLKDVPAAILKLDMKFFENSGDSKRAGNIIESMVRMSKWLGMSIIAEGVETKAQADYLLSIGSKYIQGYLYAKPMPLADYEALQDKCAKNPKLDMLEQAEGLDTNTFWDPKSIETIMFNSFVGGACIFEYHDGTTELIRVNSRYAQELGCFAPPNGTFGTSELPNHLYGKDKEVHDEMIEAAVRSRNEESREMMLTDPNQPQKVEYIRISVRVIASTERRHLFYCMIRNFTKQRLVERAEKETARRLHIIMKNISGGVSAITVDDTWHAHFIFNNERYFEIFGYTRQQAESEKYDPFAQILSEDMDSVMKAFAKMRATMKPSLINFRAHTHNGGLIYLQARTTPMKMDDVDDLVYISVINDITAQRQLSEQLSVIINNLNGGVLVTVTRNGVIEFLLDSDKFYELVGYTKEQYAEELGRDVFKIIRPQDKRPCSKSMGLRRIEI